MSAPIEPAGSYAGRTGRHLDVTTFRDAAERGALAAALSWARRTGLVRTRVASGGRTVYGWHRSRSVRRYDLVAEPTGDGGWWVLEWGQGDRVHVDTVGCALALLALVGLYDPPVVVTR